MKPAAPDNVPKIFGDLVENCCKFEANERWNFQKICEILQSDEFAMESVVTATSKNQISIKEEYNVFENKETSDTIDSVSKSIPVNDTAYAVTPRQEIREIKNASQQKDAKSNDYTTMPQFANHELNDANAYGSMPPKNES